MPTCPGLPGSRLVRELPEPLAEEPKNSTLLRDALYQLTGRRLGLAFTLGESAADEPEDATASEEDIYQLVKETFDAREVEE